MKYLISISYDGSKYCGLQKLKNENTVQGELEKILTKLNESPVTVKAAGRTDKGVHALDQKCHFELNKDISPYRLRYYLNRMSSPYLYIKDCQIIEDKNFHARFSVKSKIYLYKINIGEYDAINSDYIYNYNEYIDIKKMNKAAKILIGANNYKCFVTGKHKTYDSIIDYIRITKFQNIISVEIKGKAFYTYMIRNIVKILILYGTDKIDKSVINKMIKEQVKQIEYSPAPANGLYLKKIEY